MDPNGRNEAMVSAVIRELIFSVMMKLNEWPT